ncbi:MAG TPA: oligosaccharide flippase family protein [Candidatus Sulfotelmatobacter sp.]|nr:oligosaccharide flippase family protein [Candidatus Sulfotelmatobacter sp.]
MTKVDKVALFKNVGSSWFALGINVLAGIFLSPYILHHLGDEAFGLWVLIFSVTGYYGLFDLGIRSSIIRYVAKYSTVAQNDDLNRLINTALFSYSAIGAVALLITITLSFNVGSIFRISGDSIPVARWLFLMVGASVALGFPLGVFGGILEGLQRFYVLNITSVAATTMRALLIVIALHYGYGLLTVTLITVALPLFTSLINATIVLRVLPLRFGTQHLSRESLRRIASYSGTTFIIIVATRLRFKTDALVIGTFLSSAAITYFTIGSRLVDYAGEVVSGLAQLFVPMSSKSDATGDLAGLRKIFVAGNRACALIIFPIAALLIILGKSVIEAWVGARYVATSYPVLLILVVPYTLMLAQSASTRVLFGMAKHRTLAIVILLEGASNLMLSILLVRPFGILGDAVGTAIPLACTTLVFLPRHLCRVLNLRIGVYLREAFLLPFMLCVPLIAVLLLMRHWFVAHTVVQLGIHLAAGSVAYGVGLLWAIWTRKAWQVEGIHDIDEANQVAIGLIDTYQQDEA